MSNPQQNEIQNEIEQINREIKIYCRINIRKTKKKTESISKWAKGSQKKILIKKDRIDLSQS